MLIEEDDSKGTTSDLSPDALEAFEEDLSIDEEVVVFSVAEDEEADELDMAFIEDEGHW